MMEKENATWIRTCAKRIVELDPAVCPDDALEIADFMSETTRWSDINPETAADTIFAESNQPLHPTSEAADLRAPQALQS